MSGQELKKWYAVYCKPRWEKKVHQGFVQAGLHSYCPLQKVKRQWSDRIKTVQMPLFPSYVFVQLADEEMEQVRRVAGVVNFVYRQGKPAIIRHKEIMDIQRFLSEYDEVGLEQWEEGAKVMIQSGPLMHQQAEVVQRRGRKVRLRLQDMGCSLYALVPAHKIIKLDSTKSKKQRFE